MQSLTEQMEAQLKKINGVQEQVPVAVIAPVVEDVVVPVEPIVKTTIEVVTPQAQNVKNSEKLTSFKWATTRLNLILIQNDGNPSDSQTIEHNGREFWLNKPFNSIETDDIPPMKLTGYLMTNLVPFIEQLQRMTEPSEGITIATNEEMVEYFKTVSKMILTNMQRILPKVENRFDVYCSIDKEENSLVDKICLEFYLAYKTDYTMDEILARAAKLDGQLSRFINSNFEIVLTNVFDLDNFPNNLVPWLEMGYTKESYMTSQVLPNDKETRLSILGSLPGTKQFKPAVVLSKPLVYSKPKKVK